MESRALREDGERWRAKEDGGDSILVEVEDGE